MEPIIPRLARIEYAVSRTLTATLATAMYVGAVGIHCAILFIRRWEPETVVTMAFLLVLVTAITTVVWGHIAQRGRVGYLTGLRFGPLAVSAVYLSLFFPMLSGFVIGFGVTILVIKAALNVHANIQVRRAS